jgi:hypothetical protein
MKSVGENAIRTPAGPDRADSRPAARATINGPEWASSLAVGRDRVVRDTRTLLSRGRRIRLGGHPFGLLLALRRRECGFAARPQSFAIEFSAGRGGSGTANEGVLT